LTHRLALSAGTSQYLITGKALRAEGETRFTRAHA
jgi:hypothetical protein